MGRGRSVLSDALDIGLNYMTAGLVGYDESGKLRTGGLLHAIDEGVGEITGRNARREAMHQEARLVREEEARRNQMMADEREGQARSDLMASRMAGSGRRQATRSSGTRSRNTGLQGGAITDSGLGLEQDFLGL